MHDLNYFACVPPCRESGIFVGLVAAATGNGSVPRERLGENFEPRILVLLCGEGPTPARDES